MFHRGKQSSSIDRSVEWIASRFNIDRDSTIVDFGCGPGLYTPRLAKRGANVTGIDFSGRSIEVGLADHGNVLPGIDGEVVFGLVLTILFFEYRREFPIIRQILLWCPGNNPL